MAIYYNIRYYDQVGKKWHTRRDKMTEDEARERFADTQWEVIPSTREERKPKSVQTLGRLYHGHDER